MKDDRQLRDILREKIAIINNKLPKSARKEIDKTIYSKFQIQSSKVSDIFNGFEPIEATPYHMLYKLCVAIRELGEKRGDLDYSDLVIDNYFYENEKEEYSKPIPKEDEDIDVEFDDWHQTNMGAYSYIDIFTNIDYVMKLYNYNKLRFNPETQRDMIVIETGGMPIYMLDINENAITEMKDAMLSGSYFPVQGALNINPELYNEYPIKIKGNKLFIDRKFHIDLVEGFHNYLAYTKVKMDNPDWKYPCSFRLYIMNVEDANRYIGQMNKKNPFTDAQATRNDDTIENYFIKILNTSNNFDLRGTIDDDTRYYLCKIILNLFKFNNRPDAAKTLKSVTSKLNHVIMETDHFDKKFSKEEWFIYLYLIKQSIDKNIEFESLFSKININQLLEEITFKKEPVRKHYTILNNLFSEVIKNV